MRSGLSLGRPHPDLFLTNFGPNVLYLKKPGDKASMTFTHAGFYRYRCPEHPDPPGMQGLVFVT